MRQKFSILFFSWLCLFITIKCAAAQAKTPEPNFGRIGDIGDCGEIRIELVSQPIITDTLFTRIAKKCFFSFQIKITYVRDEVWKAIDPSSFELIYSRGEKTQTYPLSYTNTILASKRLELDSILDQLEFPRVYTYALVFDVDPFVYNWTLHFTPKNRGTETPVCDILLPLPQPKINSSKMHEKGYE